MNQLDALREHALFMCDGGFERLLVETARNVLNASAISVLELPEDAACGNSSNASRLAYNNSALVNTVQLLHVATCPSSGCSKLSMSPYFLNILASGLFDHMPLNCSHGYPCQSSCPYGRRLRAAKAETCCLHRNLQEESVQKAVR